MTLLLSVLSALFFLKGAISVSLVQMALSIVPALMVSAILLSYTELKFGDQFALEIAVAFIILTFVLIPTSFMMIIDGRAIVHNLVWAVQPGAWTVAIEGTPSGSETCRPKPGLERIACFDSYDSDEADAIRYIEANTGPDDPIFVGLDRHDRIWGNSMRIYFVAARTPGDEMVSFRPRAANEQGHSIGNDQRTASSEAALCSALS